MSALRAAHALMPEVVAIHPMGHAARSSAWVAGHAHWQHLLPDGVADAPADPLAQPVSEAFAALSQSEPSAIAPRRSHRLGR